MKRIRFSKKVRIALPAIVAFALIFSVVSPTEARPVNVPPVSVTAVSQTSVGFGQGVAVPTTVKETVKTKAEVTSATRVVPIGRFEDDSVSPTAGNCSYFADFNRDGSVDTRDMTAYLNDWADKKSSADMNRDGEVNATDFKLFTSQWKMCDDSQCFVADFDRDGFIDTRDITAFLNAWTKKDMIADLNTNGRVDGMDFMKFFTMWRKCTV